MPGYRGGYGGRQPGRGVTLSTRGTLSRGVVKRRVMGRPMYGDPPPKPDQRGRVGGQITIDATREAAGEPGGGAGNPVPVTNQYVRLSVSLTNRDSCSRFRPQMPSLSSGLPNAG